jgi:hypothetical protein
VHFDFERAGARLSGEAKARYAAIVERLATLSTQFGQNVLADEASYRLLLKDEREHFRPVRARDVFDRHAVGRLPALVDVSAQHASACWRGTCANRTSPCWSVAASRAAPDATPR